MSVDLLGMGQSLAVAMPCPMEAPPAYSVLQPEGLISGVVAPVIKNSSVQSEGDLLDQVHSEDFHT